MYLLYFHFVFCCVCCIPSLFLFLHIIRNNLLSKIEIESAVFGEWWGNMSLHMERIKMMINNHHYETSREKYIDERRIKRDEFEKRLIKVRK